VKSHTTVIYLNTGLFVLRLLKTEILQEVQPALNVCQRAQEHPKNLPQIMGEQLNTVE
jgi:hypothetical protein